MKDIPGYEGLYAVTSCGKVWSYRNKKFLKPRANRHGYLIVTLCNDKHKTYTIHRLVAQTYIPNPENLPQINHKDENKTNNCLQNLEWCDVKYNSNYGTRNKKISNSHKIPILQYTLDGEFVREWPCAIDIGRVAQTNIISCLKGRTKTAYGFIWKYKDWYKHILANPRQYDYINKVRLSGTALYLE